MKQQHFRFRILSVLMILLLVSAGIYGCYSVSIYGNRWASSTHNTRYRKAKANIIPGNIVDKNNVLIASSDEKGDRIYQPDLLSRASLVHLLGDTEGNVANGVESFQAAYLLGMKSNFAEEMISLFSREQRQGDTVKLTIDSKLCTDIVKNWRNNSSTSGKCGAVVVMNYRTGEIIAMVSLPVYDPSNITDAVKNSKQYPFWNRATQTKVAPGSTFKIITTLCALQNLKDATEKTYDCTGALQVGETAITDAGDEVHGILNMAQAFSKSCNNTFAQIALEVGDRKLKATAERFGFNDNFLFKDLVLENSSYPTKNRTQKEIAWSGAGQSAITATPVHMCMIGAAIANDGLMMEPKLISEIISPNGLTKQSFSSREYRRACDPKDAAVVQAYMRNVVTSGTGTRAHVDGLKVCGKTGSAESTLNGKAITHAWFVGYIDSEKLPYAVCVFVEEGGSGGKVAAPVANQVFHYLKENGGE